MTDRDGITPHGLEAGQIVAAESGSLRRQEVGGEGVSVEEGVAGVEGVDG